MRIADRPTEEVAVHVDAPPRPVWDLVTDIELPTRFSPELRTVRWLDGAHAPAVGARFEGHNHNDMLGGWRTVAEVVECAAPHVFGWAVLDTDGRFGPAGTDPAHPAATWRFVLDPVGAGTRLRLAVRLGTAPSGLTAVVARAPEREEAIVAGRLAQLREGMHATLDGIRTLAEAAP